MFILMLNKFLRFFFAFFFNSCIIRSKYLYPDLRKCAIITRRLPMGALQIAAARPLRKPAS
jgi:hypothetical protein